jgi:hypothetical protein
MEGMESDGMNPLRLDFCGRSHKPLQVLIARKYREPETDIRDGRLVLLRILRWTEKRKVEGGNLRANRSSVQGLVPSDSCGMEWKLQMEDTGILSIEVSRMDKTIWVGWRVCVISSEFLRASFAKAPPYILQEDTRERSISIFPSTGETTPFHLLELCLGASSISGTT